MSKHGQAEEAYWIGGARGFIAACLVYLIVQVTYYMPQVVGIWGGLAITGGTGILLGLVMEWLRRKGL